MLPWVSAPPRRGLVEFSLPLVTRCQRRWDPCRALGSEPVGSRRQPERSSLMMMPSSKYRNRRGAFPSPAWPEEPGGLQERSSRSLRRQAMTTDRL